MDADVFRELAAAHAIGALDRAERAAFEEHLSGGCPGCAAEIASHRAVLAAVTGREPMPATEMREHVLEMAEAPAAPIDVDAYAWQELRPGIRIHVLREDPARRLRCVLVWARPGARYPRHRHLGDEEILVLQGTLQDDRAIYGPGDICRSRAGSTHSEEALPGGGEDCICFVVYHGDHEMLED